MTLPDRLPLTLRMLMLGAIMAGAALRVTAQPVRSSVSDGEACARLAHQPVENGTVLSAVAVAATRMTPAFCRVSGIIRPALHFEMRLPESWNGKLHYGGGGGYDGYIPPLYGADLAALKNGYIDVVSDSGHQGLGIDATWAIGNPGAVKLYGYLAVPLVMAAAQHLIRVAYGKPANRAYFEGCSNGGREALMSAQRYPKLFNGIIAGAPVIGMPALLGFYNRMVKALAVPGAYLTPGKLRLLTTRVIAACGRGDGVIDGALANPAGCHFDPRQLQCPRGVDAGPNCLSDAQLAVIESWTEPVSFLRGTLRYPGFSLTGSEGDANSWDFWVLSPVAPITLFQYFGIKGLVERSLAVNPLTYDYNSNPPALRRLEALVDPGPDLRAYAAAGGKLIIWHGGTDMSLSPRMTAEYYERVVSALGGQDDVRYYVLPGVDHCGGGRGADSVDWLAVLDDWVTKGRPPAALIAKKRRRDGTVAFTRPVCEYPQYLKYVGSHNDPLAAASASSYVCVPP